MDTPYVSEAAAVRALAFEARFLSLPPSVGVLFVSVEAVPVVGGDSNAYNVRIGISRQFSTRTGELLIQNVMRKEMVDGLVINASAFRGQRTG